MGNLKTGILLAPLFLSSAGLLFGQTENQKMVLFGKPDKPRFELKDVQWPEKVGEASVCLWKNDAVAAFSITIDDNCAPDHAWWLETGKKYGIPLTWFVITERINGKSSFDGTWDNFRKLVDAGHDVGSHTARHLHTEDPGWKDIEAEYAGSKKAIEDNIKGHKALVLAYPGAPHPELNNPVIAAKYYIGCRGSTGGLNMANKIVYDNTADIAGLHIDDSRSESQNLLTAVEKGKAKNPQLYRSWYCCHFHAVKPENRDQLTKPLEYVASKVQSGELWAGLFRDVVMYGQERDTASLDIQSVSKDKIVLRITDTMDDSIFNYPLTVKVRLDSSWKTVEAVQNSGKVDCRFVTNNGNNYALIQVVPDKGDAVITGK